MKEKGFSLNLPKQVRVSLGSAVVLGLAQAKLDALPTTAYLMTYHQQKCTANCAFCPQARTSQTSLDMLSRVSWPLCQIDEVLKGISAAVKSRGIKRVCIQALNYPRVFTDLQALVKAVRNSADVPISVSCQPFDGENIYRLASAGVERIGIPLDAAVKRVFDRIKGADAGGPYSWKKQWQLLRKAREVFGKGRVSTHLIVGIGETEKEMVKAIQRCTDMGVLPALFAFTPVRGTTLGNQKQPTVEQYRRIQVARNLIWHGTTRCGKMSFDQKGAITSFGISNRRLLQVMQTGEPFLTTGCPHCNRPFYNEKPSGPIYNFPRELTPTELSTSKNQLQPA
jgi:biotin synthase